MSGKSNVGAGLAPNNPVAAKMNLPSSDQADGLLVISVTLWSML
jgi:hypothetical protein